MKEKIAAAVKLRNDKNPEQAIALLKELLALEPENAEVNYQIAWTFDSLGAEADAVPYYVVAIQNGLSDENRRGAMLGLGSTYRCLGQYQKSLEVFEKAVNEFPGDRALKVFKALTLHNLGKSEKAIEEILVILLDTTNDSAIQSYERALRFYSDKLSEKW